MEEAERRLSYQYQRVLLETTRVLSPQFDDTLICLTGAELELLRNVCTYFHLRSSFVSQYDETYYLCPDDEDWDDIQAIVADLEEKLMGCQDIADDIASIKAYAAAIAFDLELVRIEQSPIAANESVYASGDGEANQSLLFTACPDDYRMKVYGLFAVDTSNACSQIRFEYEGAYSSRQFYSVSSVAGGQPIVWVGPISLEAGDQLKARFSGATTGDNLRAVMWAERFEVPGGT